MEFIHQTLSEESAGEGTSTFHQDAAHTTGS
jgi:hypothetical protein